MLTRKEVHRLVVEKILQLRPKTVAALRLISRLYNDELVGSSDVRDVYFLLPDLHLLTKATETGYRYGFLKVQPGIFLGSFALRPDTSREGQRRIQAVLTGLQPYTVKAKG